MGLGGLHCMSFIISSPRYWEIFGVCGYNFDGWFFFSCSLNTGMVSTILADVYIAMVGMELDEMAFLIC